MIGFGYGRQNLGVNCFCPQGRMGSNGMNPMGMQIMMRMMMQLISQLSAMSSGGGFNMGRNPGFGQGGQGGCGSSPLGPGSNFLGGGGNCRGRFGGGGFGGGGNCGGGGGSVGPGVGNVPPSFNSSVNSNYSGQQRRARGTGYYPDSSAMEGGYVDRKGKKLNTLQDFLEGRAPYVSVAMDNKAGIPYGQTVRIPEIEKKYGRQIPFRVVDTGGAFKGRGTSRIDICTRNRQASLDPVVNGPLTLQFK